MSPATPDAGALEQLIEEATGDCYNDDEPLAAFHAVLEEQLKRTAVSAAVGGFTTMLTAVGHVSDRRGLVTRVRHGASTRTVALFDVEVNRDADAQVVMPLAAYRLWCAR